MLCSINSTDIISLFVFPEIIKSYRVALAEAINGNLFFAGEATDVLGDWGTVNGALNSGERVALEVIEAIVNPVT
ncbi:hypothetical protein SanaruYs_27720 [Chryseotalea sanaruensis]|uniref:Amine oxidase domain-containing protein n=1 Tax=Chryseotalea sanaruensis TaxID=2482724 RepID=A0A401UCC6_9BACT|nr:FAD-dependent oxidoreductase [Chryseotalea sanaruensis]GCC52535.1 hypothetical protein SanaruYs_27720 [Chryseotalea sanaruensis]